MNPSVLTTIILGLAGLLLTLIYNYHNRRMAKDRMNKELFTEFNKRYDSLNEYLEQIVSTCNNINELNAQPILRYKLNDYFNLCAEEYYWHTKNRIDKRIWHSWEEGMNRWYNKYPVIQEAWDEELLNYGHKTFYMKNGQQFFKKDKLF